MNAKQNPAESTFCGVPPGKETTMHHEGYPMIHHLRAALVVVPLAVAMMAGFASAASAATKTPAPCIGDGMSRACGECIVSGDETKKCAPEGDSPGIPGSVQYRRNAVLEKLDETKTINRGPHAGLDESWSVSLADHALFEKNRAEFEERRDRRAAERARAAQVATEEPTPSEPADPPPGTTLDAAGPGLSAAATASPAATSQAFAVPGWAWTLGVLAAALAAAQVVRRRRPDLAARAALVGSLAATRAASLGRASGPYVSAATRGWRRIAVPVVRWAVVAPQTGGQTVVRLILLVFAPVIWLNLPLPGIVLAGLPVVMLVAAGGWPQGKSSEVNWYSHRRLVEALTNSGAVKPAKNGERLVIHYRGKPVIDEHGTAVTVALPNGAVVSDVSGRLERFSAALGVPLDRLTVEGICGQPANVARIWVGTGKRHEAERVVLPMRTNWKTPVRIGITDKGSPVIYALHEHSGLVGGMPGYGKTALCRNIAAHAMLDPTVGLFVIDAKAMGDWDAAKDAANAFVAGSDEEDVNAALDILRALLVKVKTWRKGDPPIGLLVIDEPQELRQAAKKKQREEIDELLGRLTRLGRAAGLHVLGATQRPTAADIPTGWRAVISQRIALVTRSAGESAFVLGDPAPSLKLPGERGEAIVRTPADPDRLVRLDHLGDDAWAEACARAPRRTPLVADEPAEVRDPLVEAVGDVLRAAEGGQATASAILAGLPDDLRPESPAALGRSLKARGIASRATSAGRVYRLADIEASA